MAANDRMKKLLLLLALLFPIGVIGQPILRNTATTNNPPLFFFSFPGPGVGGTVANPVFADSSNVLWQLDGSLTDVHLHLTNLPGTTSSAPINNFYVTNLFVQNGGHNTMIITNSLTIQPVKTNVLATTSTGLVTNANYGSGISWDPTTLTISATASGSGVTTVVTPLAYSGTNITGFNCLTNNATYTLLLTNHCLFDASTFTGLPNTTTNLFFTLGLKQDSAGTWVPKFTNSIVAWADGVQPVIKTNANAVSYLYFHTHLFTNGMLVGSPNLNVQ